MKTNNVVTQLKRIVPRYTTLFHDTVALSSLTLTGNLATAISSAKHGLSTGQEVTISGVETRTPIVATEAGETNLLRYFETGAPQDLTTGNPRTPTVRFIGFTDSAWNDEHELVAVPNRNVFQVKTATVLSPPTLNGAERLLEPYRVDGPNGLHLVTALSPSSFTFPGEFIAGTYTPINGRVSSAPRISAAVDIDRAATIARTPIGGRQVHWMFVVPEDATVIKDRNSDTDAVATALPGQDYRQRIIDNFTVAIFAPCATELDASRQLDICRHDLQQPLLASLYGVVFPTGLSCESKIRTMFRGHSVLDYQKAWMIYGYQFQAIYDIESNDAFFSDSDRAFRDLDYTQQAFIDLTASVDLDEEPAA